jgi:hypothetical protein
MNGKRTALILTSVAILLTLTAKSASAPAPVTFSGSGPDAASIQSVVDAFRSALGALNPNVSGSFGTGRREINWDGVPDISSAPNILPPDFFNNTSPRGVLLLTPSVGVQVSQDDDTPSDADPDLVRFDTINPTYSSTFKTFSSQRLFTAVGGNIVDVIFVVPGSPNQATVSGFGAVFTDVDIDNTTSIEVFGGDGGSLGVFFVPAANNGLSFLGVVFSGDRISRVRLKSGNAALSTTNIDGGVDVVAMDDFIYGEPVLTFDRCLQDDSNRNILLFSSTTGDYQFTNCAGLLVGGRATVRIKGSLITLEQSGPDRRLAASVDGSTNKGRATLQLLSPFATFSVIDRNITDSPCVCTVTSR